MWVCMCILCNHQHPRWSSHDTVWLEIDVTGLSRQLAMICRASDRPPTWARSASHETEQMLGQSANHRWASGKRWHHRQIRAHAASFLVVVSYVQQKHSHTPNALGGKFCMGKKLFSFFLKGCSWNFFVTLAGKYYTGKRKVLLDNAESFTIK